jgi:hypothetical protein
LTEKPVILVTNTTQYVGPTRLPDRSATATASWHRTQALPAKEVGALVSFFAIDCGFITGQSEPVAGGRA